MLGQYLAPIPEVSVQVALDERPDHQADAEAESLVGRTDRM